MITEDTVSKVLPADPHAMHGVDITVPRWDNIKSGGKYLGRLCGRAKRRPVNLTTKQSSELNSVGPETSKSMKFFWFGPLPVMTSSPLIRLQRPLPPSGDLISKNENRTL